MEQSLNSLKELETGKFLFVVSHHSQLLVDFIEAVAMFREFVFLLVEAVEPFQLVVDALKRGFNVAKLRLGQSAGILDASHLLGTE